MFDFDAILKGYSSEQYGEALMYIIVNFLNEKGLINMQEFKEYHKNNLNELLNKIVDRDKKEVEERINKLKGDPNDKTNKENN